MEVKFSFKLEATVALVIPGTSKTFDIKAALIAEIIATCYSKIYQVAIISAIREAFYIKINVLKSQVLLFHI